MEAPSLNKSEHAAYTEYYGDALAKLVAERDAPVIAQFGYEFGK